MRGRTCLLGGAAVALAIVSVARPSYADSKVLNLTCKQDARSLLIYNLWINLEDGLITVQSSWNGQAATPYTESVKITPSEFLATGITVDRTTGSAEFNLNGYQTMQCQEGNMPLPQPQTKF